MDRCFCSIALVAAGACFSASSAATTTPPKYPTIEEEVCSAGHIFIGTAARLSIIPAPEGFKCDSLQLNRNVAVCSATVIAMDIRVERVVAPRTWVDPGTVVLLLPTGYSLHGTRAIYEGQRHMFKTAPRSDSANNFHSPAYWGISFAAQDEGQVEQAVSKCGPRY